MMPKVPVSLLCSIQCVDSHVLRSAYPRQNYWRFLGLFFGKAGTQEHQGRRIEELKCCIKNKLRYRLDLSNFSARLAQQFNIHA